MSFRFEHSSLAQARASLPVDQLHATGTAEHFSREDRGNGEQIVDNASAFSDMDVVGMYGDVEEIV